MSSPNRIPANCTYTESYSETELVTLPASMCEPATLTYDVGKYQARAWVVEPTDNQEVEAIIVALHGWRSSPAALGYFAAALAATQPGLAVVLPEQPRVLKPTERRSLPSYYLNESSKSNVGELRTRSALHAGAAACKRYGIDSLSVVGHSLGAVDAVNMSVEANSFQVNSLTAFMGAGLLRHHVKASLKSHLSPLALRNFHAEPLQVMSEARYAISQDISPKLAQLIDSGTSLHAVDAANDQLFDPNPRRSLYFPDGYTVISDGCACHCSLTHRSEAPRMAKVYNDMQAGMYRGHPALNRVSRAAAVTNTNSLVGPELAYA